MSMVRDWALARRAESWPQAPAAPSWRAPEGRGLARLMSMEPEALPEPKRLLVAQVAAELPALGQALAVARRLRRVLRRDGDDSLQDVLGAANATLLAGFATGLHRDLAAVQAAFDLP